MVKNNATLRGYSSGSIFLERNESKGKLFLEIKKLTFSLLIANLHKFEYQYAISGGFVRRYGFP
jgi:hypothetical protein